MKVVETVKKYLVFSVDDKTLVESILRDDIGRKTMKNFFEWPIWWVPLIGAWGKISGTTGDCDVMGITFNSSEKHAICDVLRAAYHNPSKYDQETRDRICEILTTIFDN